MNRQSWHKRLVVVGGAILIWFAAGEVGGAQNTPAITSISPTSVTAGGPNFTLTVTGSGFLANSVVQINGNNRPTVYVSALKLTATIFSTDIATPATLVVTVFTRFATGGGLASNGVPLAVSALPAPSLISVSPGFTSQGGDHIRMTLVGANFRPGATVVISPPLTSISNSNGHTRATDVAVLSAVVVNSGLVTALISVAPRATLGLRAADVLNLDGTSTAGSLNAAGGTSQPVEVESSNSLGAPVSVLNMALLHPRDGTVVMQGQELIAEAILAGTGTGTVAGQWIWDGNVVEQFTASIVGGQSTTIQTRQSLPTWYLGSHTLVLRMVQPSQVASRPILVVVNPGDWKLEQLILPQYGETFPSDLPPRLLWAPVPGAAKYQVGFSTQPHLATIENWFDVVDNQWEVPDGVWRNLPSGQLYWTVRAVETSGAPRKPLPMRSVYRVAEGGLTSVRPKPARTAAGHTLLEWKPAQTNGYYFVTISSDAEATQVIRQYLTADPKLDLRVADRKLTPGNTYYWQVDAIAPNGALIMSGPVQSFVAEALPDTSLNRDGRLVQLASLGVPESLPSPPDLTAQITGQMPAPNSSTNQLQPMISVGFQSPVNPADISLMIDDVDVTTLAQLSDVKVAFTPPMALSGGDHNVNLTVGSEATTWKFTVVAPSAPATTAVLSLPPAGTVQPGTDAEAAQPGQQGALPTSASVAAAHRGAKAREIESRKERAPKEEGQISSTTQWASASNPPDTNVLSVAERMSYNSGAWHVEVNGSGLLNSVLNPEVQRTSQGRFSDYVIQLGYKKGDFAANLRFGTVSPVLYTDAQFVTAATPRQGVEATLKTLAGTFGYFVNTNDTALGGGAGINFHQQMMGASWQAPLPKWAMFRADVVERAGYGCPDERVLRFARKSDHPTEPGSSKVDGRCVRRTAQYSSDSEVVVVVGVRVQPGESRHEPVLQ